jgi:type II secretory pathway component GspD/PulD (secretin)
MRLRALTLVLLVSGGTAFADDTAVEILTVRNRPAADLVGVLQPLAGPGGGVAASGDKLVVHASPAALARIRATVAALDVTPRMLTITVRQGGDRSASTTAAEGSVVAGSGHVRATGVFAHGTSQQSGTDVQRLAVVEGGRAFIRTGSAQPVPTVGVVSAPGGGAVVQGTTYQDVESGFYVRPRLAGETVTLELSTRGDRLAADGAIDVQDVDTTVSGRLGEWIALGGLSRSEQSHGSGILSTSRGSATDERTVEVMVELGR